MTNGKKWSRILKSGMFVELNLGNRMRGWDKVTICVYRWNQLAQTYAVSMEAFMPSKYLTPRLQNEESPVKLSLFDHSHFATKKMKIDIDVFPECTPISVLLFDSVC